MNKFLTTCSILNESMTMISHKKVKLSEGEIQDLISKGHGQKVYSCGHMNQCRCPNWIHENLPVQNLKSRCPKCVQESQTPTSKVSVNLYGRADRKNFTEQDADPKELAMGIKVEMEHTIDPKVSKKIALDHLSEEGQEHYYSNLINMEKSSKEKKLSMEIIY